MIGQVFVYWETYLGRQFGALLKSPGLSFSHSGDLVDLARSLGRTYYDTDATVDLDDMELFSYAVPQVMSSLGVSATASKALDEHQRRQFREVFRQAYRERRREVGLTRAMRVVRS